MKCKINFALTAPSFCTGTQEFESKKKAPKSFSNPGLFSLGFSPLYTWQTTP